MRLYRHSTLCGTAVQMFLDCNSQYWCCVPMKDNDAHNDDLVYAQMPKTINIINGHRVNDHPSLDYGASTAEAQVARTDEETQWYVDNLPIPPTGYRFSQRQRFEQYLFFKYQQDLMTPCSHLDLYNATIVFVRMYSIFESTNEPFFFLFSTEQFFGFRTTLR
jgi:hypothetical protein